MQFRLLHLPGVSSGATSVSQQVMIDDVIASGQDPEGRGREVDTEEGDAYFSSPPPPLLIH